MAASNRWAARKGGSFVARDALSFEQQTILAAVPRWKKEWVRPANLQPGQNPDYKILKWVIDTAADKSSGTAEEMEAAVENLAANAGGETSLGTSDIARTSPIPTGQAKVSGAVLATSTNPLGDVLHSGSAQMGGIAQTVQEAVRPLQGLPEEGLIDGRDTVQQKDKSLMEE